MFSANYGATENGNGLTAGNKKQEVEKNGHLTNSSRSVFFYIVVVAGCLVSLAFISLREDGISQQVISLKKSNSASGDSSSDFWFTLYREGYSSLGYFSKNSSSVLTYKILSGYDAVIEPHKTMHVEVENFVLGGDYDYKFSICGDHETDSCKHGYRLSDGSNAGISIDCSPYDVYRVKVSKYNAGDDDGVDAVSETSGSALCLYVRREIRSLTADDLKDTMDAMFVMWDIDTESGQAKYGENFADAASFVAAHEFNSAQQDADHMHEGIGFLPQHIKMTNMFEDSMVAIDPSVSLPYWDFTIDRAASVSIFDSNVFTEDIFGTLKRPNNSFWGWTYKYDKLEDAYIQDGRWEKIEVAKNTKFPELKNSFGTVRGTWTVNPSNYVSRFTTTSPVLPGCSTHYDLLSMTDLGAFFYTVNNSPHASSHGAVAATFGCDVMDQMLDHGYLSDTDAQLGICTQWGFILKDLFRANYLSAKDNCSYTSFAREDIDCGFTCNEDMYDDMPAVLESAFKSTWTNAKMTETGWEAWRSFICEGEGFKVFFGDHLDPSVSPADPSFWVLHPTLERILHAKYMSGGFDDDVWPSDPINDYVCSLAECYNAEYGGLGNWDECCYGHYEYDQLMDYKTGNRSQGVGPSTHDLLIALRPDSSDYSMPYIYDSFTWDHCDEDFAGLIDELSTRDESKDEDVSDTKETTVGTTNDKDTTDNNDKTVQAESDSTDSSNKVVSSKDEDSEKQGASTTDSSSSDSSDATKPDKGKGGKSGSSGMTGMQSNRRVLSTRLTR